MPPKDLVGAKGAAINDRERIFIDLTTNSQISLSIKKEAYNAALRAALGWADSPVAGKKVHKETQKEAIKDWGCIPVTIEYQNDTEVSHAKTVAKPGTDLDTLIGLKYHGTLDIIGYSIGH